MDRGQRHCAKGAAVSIHGQEKFFFVCTGAPPFIRRGSGLSETCRNHIYLHGNLLLCH